MTIGIDTNICNGCRKCTIVCPLKVLEFSKENVAIVVRPDYCARCAHCMSVCPVNAIYGDFKDFSIGKNTSQLDMPAPKQVENFILSRRSIRAYSEKCVEEDKIEKLLAIAVHAPTARNAQNVHFIVAGPEKSAVLESMLHDYYSNLEDNVIGSLTRDAGYKILLGAPLTIGIYGDKWESKNDLNENLWNCLIAGHTLLLAAHGFGLGGCYNGLLCIAYDEVTAFKEFFNLPEDKRIYMFLTLGYPAKGIKYYNIINRKRPEIKWL